MDVIGVPWRFFSWETNVGVHSFRAHISDARSCLLLNADPTNSDTQYDAQALQESSRIRSKIGNRGLLTAIVVLVSSQAVTHSAARIGGAALITEAPTRHLGWVVARCRQASRVGSDCRDLVCQNPSVEAPFTIASTTIAAVTIFDPGIRCSSVIPRGFRAHRTPKSVRRGEKGVNDLGVVASFFGMLPHILSLRSKHPPRLATQSRLGRHSPDIPTMNGAWRAQGLSFRT